MHVSRLLAALCVSLVAYMSVCAADSPPPAAAASSAKLATRGKILFLRCSSCHDVSSTDSPKIGPNLQGIVGRKVGSLPGFKYSPAMSAQNFVWDEAALDRWLTNPGQMVPGTAMAFGGIPEAADRKALIAFLKK
jgi:cytochrome c